MLIAVVEDEKMMNQYIQNLLIKTGWDTEGFYSAEKFLDKAKETKYDCVVIDINLKLMTGFDIIYFLKKYHDKYGDIKTVILSSETQQESVNKGFHIGVDDYIKKPFDDDEFIFRILNVLKVSNAPSAKKVYYKDATFDFEKFEAIFNNQKIKLTLHEVKVLEYFLLNKGIVISRDKFHMEIWQEAYEKGDKKMDLCVSRLKKKFPIFSDNIIAHRGTGYRLLS